MSPRRVRLVVQGVVQGVGFRPFVYRTAVENGLTGSVKNRGDAGVEIFIEGRAESIDAFLHALENDPPPLARIRSIDTIECEPIGEAAFAIHPSSVVGGRGGVLPPDVATCEACVSEILGQSRFSGYWATSCTDCGPRFTVIESLPYDRPRTSMRDFPMCDTCDAEYRDPLERRYHAQTTACAACGPELTFDGASKTALDQAIEVLQAGKIVAIKGIGGTHLACDATDQAAVDELRARVGRPSQPYAVMATPEMVDSFAAADPAEWEALHGPERPIVVLRKRLRGLADSVAPGLHTVGVMLPYTGLHHLLFSRIDRPLVMTSANLPGRPMLIDNNEIEQRLGDVADHLLLHNRRIVARCDDSVQRYVGGRFVFLRRSRGWVPQPIRVGLGNEPILALGPETDLTFSIYADEAVTVSQHIGSVDDLETIEFLREAIDHLYRITRAAVPQIVACDLHPMFATTRLADELAEQYGARLVRVQHHAAHLLSVMAEHDLNQAVGIILDGYGYGWDAEAWGGELLMVQGGAIRRSGSLRAVRMPGGDMAAREPLRMAAALLRAGGMDRNRVTKMLEARGLRGENLELLLMQIDRGVNAPWTTSAGRFLDAVAAWLGICCQRTYEGEPAMRLEALAADGAPAAIELHVEHNEDGFVIDTVDLFRRLVELAETEPVEDVAATAQTALAIGTARAATALAKQQGIRDVCFSGGVAYNTSIASVLCEAIESAGLCYHTNEAVPCGDGGISFGQAAYSGRGIEILEADRSDATAGDGGQ